MDSYFSFMYDSIIALVINDITRLFNNELEQFVIGLLMNLGNKYLKEYSQISDFHNSHTNQSWLEAKVTKEFLTVSSPAQPTSKNSLTNITA